MTLINEVNANELIEKTAEELKKLEELKAPKWAAFCKTGMHRERPPARDDWWQIRAAAILRTTAIKGPIGVSKLRTKYGGRMNRGHKPDRFARGSGNIIRKLFQQLEKAQLIKKQEKGVHKGRIITPKGLSLIDKAAVGILKLTPRPKKKPVQAAGVEEKEPEAGEEPAEKQEQAVVKPKKEKITIST